MKRPDVVGALPFCDLASFSHSACICALSQYVLAADASLSQYHGTGLQQISTFSASRPMTDTMPEGDASDAACMLSPRSFTSFSPSSKLFADRQSNNQNRGLS